MTYNTGDTVSWKRGNGTASGTIIELSSDTVSLETEGNEVTRHGSSDDKAVTIEQDDGTKVLKLESELE